MTPKEQIEQFMRGEWTKGGFNRIFSYYGVTWQEGAFEIHWRATEDFTTGADRRDPRRSCRNAAR